MNVNSSMILFDIPDIINIFRILQKICLERAQDYAKRVHIEFDKWNKFGYESSYPELLPTGDPDSERALNDALPKVFRCTVCGKFRAILDFEKLESIDPAFFVCSDNPDPVSTWVLGGPFYGHLSAKSGKSYFRNITNVIKKKSVLFQKNFK